MLAAVLPTLLFLHANPYLDDARRLVDQLHYPQAEAKLRTARDVPTNTPDERREVYDLLVRAVAAQGRIGEAESLYADLLAKDPDAPAPVGVSPKIRDAFTSAKRRVYPPGFARLEQLSSAPGRIELKLVDPWQSVAQVVLSERTVGAIFHERTVTPTEGRYVAELGTLLPGAHQEVFIEARAADGKILAAIGSADQPLTFDAPAAVAKLAAPPPEVIAPPPPPPGPATWPKWVVLGATAAAAGAGAWYAVGSAGDAQRAADPSTPVTQMRALDGSARDKALARNAFAGAALAGAAAFVVLAWKW